MPRTGKAPSAFLHDPRNAVHPNCRLQSSAWGCGARNSSRRCSVLAGLVSRSRLGLCKLPDSSEAHEEVWLFSIENNLKRERAVVTT
jgi:hypothetical protein